MKHIFNRQLLLAIGFSLCLSTPQAQTRSKDSLLAVLNNKIPDTARIMALVALSSQYFGSKPDTSAQLANEALLLSRKIGFRKGEARSIYATGSVHFMIGNYPTALLLYLESLKIDEQINDLSGKGKGIGGIGLIYATQGNYREAINYYHEALQIMEQLHDVPNLCIISGNTANAYFNLKMYDSASIYAQQNYILALQLKDDHLIGLSLGIQSSISLGRSQYVLALDYLRPSVYYLERSHIWSGLSGSYFEMASVFSKMKLVDSALFYGRKAVFIAQQHGFPTQEQEAAELLSQVYRTVSADSAFHYADIAKAAKDSIFSQQKQQQIQALNFGERLRQNEKAMLAAQEAEHHKRNIQYAGIALFVLTLLIAFLVLGHTVVAGPQLIRFLGVISLLIVFEFINLLLHPWLETITHHSPILMLVSLVMLAALIVPMHHRLEHWIINRLVEKNHRIRLALGQKLVAEHDDS